MVRNWVRISLGILITQEWDWKELTKVPDNAMIFQIGYEGFNAIL